MINDVIVIGGGIAGSAAALRAVQNYLRTVWIRGDQETRRRSRGQWVVNVDNMVGIHDRITRKQVAKELRKAGFVEAQALVEATHGHIGTREIIEDVLERIVDEYPSLVEIVEAAATAAVRSEHGSFVVNAGDRSFEGAAVVLATGVMDRQPSIKRQRREEVVDATNWIYPFANRESVLYCIRCEGHLTADTCTAIIGSSPAAAEVGLMLHERYGSTCVVLTNGETPSWSEAAARVLDAYKISVLTSRIADLEGRKGALHSIKLEDGSQVDVQFALVAMGLYRVYNELARAVGAELADPEEPIEVRHVQIDKNGETSVPGFFAVGDLARRPDEGVMKQIYTAQEYAVRAVDMIDRRKRRAIRAKILG